MGIDNGMQSSNAASWKNEGANNRAQFISGLLFAEQKIRQNKRTYIFLTQVKVPTLHGNFTRQQTRDAHLILCLILHPMGMHNRSTLTAFSSYFFRINSSLLSVIRFDGWSVVVAFANTITIPYHHHYRSRQKTTTTH